MDKKSRKKDDVEDHTRHEKGDKKVACSFEEKRSLIAFLRW